MKAETRALRDNAKALLEFAEYVVRFHGAVVRSGVCGCNVCKKARPLIAACKPEEVTA